MVTGMLTWRDGLNIRSVDEEMVIMDKSSGDIHQLNPTASFIWSLCDGKMTREMVIEAVTEHYGITNTEAEKDVGHIITELKKLNLLTE